MQSLGVHPYQMQNEVHNLTKVYCIQNQIHADCSIKNVAAIGEEGGRGERQVAG